MQVFSKKTNFNISSYDNIYGWRRMYQDSFNTMLTDGEVKDFIRKQEIMSRDPKYIEMKNKIFSDNRIFYLKLLDILLTTLYFFLKHIPPKIIKIRTIKDNIIFFII